jgi:hypothetical protein
MRDCIDMRREAAALRLATAELDREATRHYNKWSSLRSEIAAKTDRAVRLEVAADMAEQAAEIAAGMRDVPTSSDSGTPS